MSKKLGLPKNDKLMHKREVDDSWFGEEKQRESPIPSSNDRFVNCRYRIPVKQKLSFISLCHFLLQMSNISMLLWSLPAQPTGKNKSSSWRGGRNIMELITVLKKGAKWPSHQRQGQRIWCSFASPWLDWAKVRFPVSSTSSTTSEKSEAMRHHWVQVAVKHNMHWASLLTSW